MRPYLAILRDSFREAIASRTLPFLLGFFTIVLVVLAPIGLKIDVPWRLTIEEIGDQTLWLAKIRQQAAQEGDNPGKRLLTRLPDDAKSRLGLAGLPAAPDAAGPAGTLLLAMSVNEHVLPDRTFYDEAAWAKIPLSTETRKLIDRDVARLPENSVQRLNRLLVSAAYSGSIEEPSDSRATITYFGFEIPFVSGFVEQFVTDPQFVRQMIRSLIYLVCVWGIGPIGLLVGIIVTADLMPRTFEAGAIDLLLSKPVNRPLLFLTRFAGACAFIFISFSYLVVGLWLIFWLRLDVWTPQILFVIPLFLFSFAVIYSISAVAGLKWRSAIVAVMVTVVVWGASFLVGFVRDGIDAVARSGARVRQITPAGDLLVVSDFDRSSYAWVPEQNDWIEQPGVLPSLAGPQAGNPLLIPKVLGPVFDPAHDRLVAAEVGNSGRNQLRFTDPKSGSGSTDGAMLPPGTTNLFITQDGRVLTAGRSGIFEFHGDPALAKKEFKIFGVIDLIPEDVANAFVRIDKPAGPWSEHAAFDLDASAETAVVYDEGNLVLLRRNDAGRFEVAAESRLHRQKTAPPAVVAVTNHAVAVVFKDGTLELRDRDDLELATSQRPFGDQIPREAVASPDGRYLAVLYHSGQLWLADLGDGDAAPSVLEEPAGQGDVSAVAFAPDGSLLVADRLRRVSRYTLPDVGVQQRMSGTLPWSEIVYRYVLTPVGYVLPDTYGLRNVYLYLFTDLKSESTTADESDLGAQRIHRELRRPIVQNLVFLAVVLGLTSVVITRKDF